jgi:hypothetical protein
MSDDAPKMKPHAILRARAHEEGRRAGYRQGLEAAAKVAESRVAPDAHPNSIAAFMSKDIAAAIRAMKDNTP